MMATCNSYIHGAKSWVVFGSEDIYGRPPWSASGSGSGPQAQLFVPVLDYGVQFTVERRQGRPLIGLRQRKHGQNFRGRPEGQITCPLFGWVGDYAGVSLAQYMLDWGFGNHEDVCTNSKSAIFFEGPGTADKEHTGLVVNQATLAGDSASGDITLTLDVMGSAENGNSDIISHPTLPINMHKLVDFVFKDATLTLDGASVDMENFSWQVQNNQEAFYLSSDSPQLYVAGDRVETLQVQIPKNSETYDALKRNLTRQRYTGVLTLQGLHNGSGPSGTSAKVTVTFNALEYAQHTDQRNPSQVFRQPLQFEVHKPDSANNGSEISWSWV